MAKTKLTPWATQTDKTEKFILAVDEALETFEEEISSLSESTHEHAYKNFITLYRDAMGLIWNLLRFANVNTVLDIIADKELSKLAVMRDKLCEKPPKGTVVKERVQIPTLEDFTETLKRKLPKKGLPDTETCSKISDIFLNLASASKAYSEDASGIAELANEIEPDQMTMLLCAATLPAIQIVIPGQLLSLIATPPPLQSAASTTMGKMDIINYMKKLVLHNSDAPELLPCDRNSATQVLAATTYCKLEHCFFEDPQSRAEVATAFKCNTSQITKVITGIIYKSGLHHYVPKKQRDVACKAMTKRAGDSPDPALVQAKTKRMMAPTLSKPSMSKTGQEPQGNVKKEDTLSSESSSSDDSTLPQGF